MLTSDDRDDFSSHSNVDASGHIRQPVLPREPSTLEALTSAIHTISTRVRAPSSPTHATHRPSRTHAPDLSSVAFPTSPVSPYSPLEEQFAPQAAREYFTRAKERETYGEAGDDGAGREEIVWSGFDRLVLEGERTPRRVLLVAYASGLQIWDTTDTDNATEILNLRDETFASISSAAVLQTPLAVDGKSDVFGDKRPLIAMARTGVGKLEVIIFSLRTHEIVRTDSFGRRGMACKGEIKCSDRYVVVATSIPPALHVLSATSLAPILKPITDICPHPTTQLPVFTLGTRLLVYATTRTLDSGMTGIITRQSQGEEAVLSSSGSSAVMELGSAAKKVGGGVLSGVRTLGEMGMAYISTRGQEPGPTIDPDERYRGFSRSAPVPSSFLSNMPSLSSLPYFYSAAAEDVRPTPKPSEYGYISVLDLDVRLPSQTFRQIAHFRPTVKPVVLLSLSPNSSLVFSATSEGRSFNIYEIRNKPRFMAGEELPHVWHRYELKRGTTPASIVRAAWSNDSRWLAVASVRGTIHLYAISPYYGTPTLDTHGSNKIRNPSNFQPLSCPLQSLVRFHFPRPAEQQATVPGASVSSTTAGSQLAFGFIPYLASISSRLIPHPQSQSRASPAPTSSPPVQAASRSPQLQPTRIPAPRRPSSSSSTSGVGPDIAVAHFQDMLVFNPADGQMSLQRCILAHSTSALATTDLTTPSGGSTPIGGRTPSTSFSSQRIPNLSSLLTSTSGRNLDVLVSTGSNVANWNLERDASWPEVKRALYKPLISHMASSAHLGRNAIRTGWLANSEIETFSQSTKILPRSIYQAHQFDFYTLPSDFRSKVRNYELELPGEKLEVRQEIQIRPAQRRLSGSSSVGDEAGAVGSFDEPIASAMHAVIDAQPSSPVIPTYPNAASPRAGHWFDAVPIRSVAHSLQGGVHEGLGRLKREMTRPRATRRRPLSEQFDDSLRFDDEYDTIFEGNDDGSHKEEDEWEGAEDQDYRQAMDNDRFDDLIVGLMDEEEEERRVMVARLQGSKPRSQSGRRATRPS